LEDGVPLLDDTDASTRALIAHARTLASAQR